MFGVQPFRISTILAQITKTSGKVKEGLLGLQFYEALVYSEIALGGVEVVVVSTILLFLVEVLAMWSLAPCSVFKYI